MKAPVLPEGPVTFADYFKLNAEIEDVLAAFGYSYRIESCKLPMRAPPEGSFETLRKNLENVFPHVGLTSEVARREFLIAPVLFQVALYADAKIRVEFPLDVDEKLHGTLDYLVRARHNVLVVEAKNGDLKRGFTQLAVELVALDRWDEGESPEPCFYGAVSIGDVWRFGILDRREKRVVEDLNTYSVPTTLNEVLQILFAVLTE